MNLAAIEPLTALGIELTSCDEQRARFHLPLAGNKNDKGSVFAGSQYSVLVISGWYLASHWAQVQALESQVAIKNAEVSYPRAAATALTTTAVFKQPPDKRPSGHWRALIEVTAFDEQGLVCSRLSGDYRILRS